MSSNKNDYLEEVQQNAMEVERQLKVKRAPNKMMQQQRIEMPIQQQSDSPFMMNNINAPASPAAQVAHGARQVQATPVYYESSNGSSKESVGALGVRITGWFRWKNVVVPPNMYVVHTRRGYEKPLHMGLGISFKFNPYLDSFLVVPSSMETILINANSICKELQGILIQAYVQWIIDDIQIAYQRLDFSDLEDPMRVVNLQLKEQAEAAIKDKVSTMSIKEVLSDKQPIIKELTKRLKEVAEGSGDDKGLGIRIVTVQIKEAIVSSTDLWQNLQKPFRAAQRTAAKLAEIENESIISQKEQEEHKKRSKEELETEAEINKIQSAKEAEEFARTQEENLRRHEAEQEAERKRTQSQQETSQLKEQSEQKLKEQKAELENQMALLRQDKQFQQQKKHIELEMEAFKLASEKLKSKMALEMAEIDKNWELQKKKLESDSELKASELKAKLARKKEALEMEKQRIEMELAYEEKRQKIANMVSSEMIQLRATELLPEIAATLPKPDHLQSIQISGGNNDASSLVGLVSSLAAVLKKQGISLTSENPSRANVDEQKGS